VEAYDRYGTLGQILAKLTVSPACRRVAPGPAEVAVTSLPSRDTWAPQLERLVGAYRMIGARSAQVLQLQSIELSERLTQATVRWRLLDGAGERSMTSTPPTPWRISGGARGSRRSPTTRPLACERASSVSGAAEWK